MIPSDSNEADGPATSTSADGDREPRPAEDEEDSESESPAILGYPLGRARVVAEDRQIPFFLVGREKIAEGNKVGGRGVSWSELQYGRVSDVVESCREVKAIGDGQKPIASSQPRQKHSQLPDGCHHTPGTRIIQRRHQLQLVKMQNRKTVTVRQAQKHWQTTVVFLC